MGAAASVDTVQAYYSEVERVVPRTPRGSRDLKRCDRDGLKEVICRATPFVKQLYDDAWTTYAAADDLREAAAALEATFSPEEPPRCALPEGASVEALVGLASEHAAALHAALKGLVRDSGGAYHRGPRKAAHRGRLQRSDLAPARRGARGKAGDPAVQGLFERR